eukprot:9452749-Karenia_brevis.AAC.1
MGIIAELFTLHGFTINYNKGKTEVLIIPGGEGARRLWDSIQKVDGASINFQGAWGPAHVCVTNNYKHVGTLE